ncbi:MAG: succinyl-diaminopimelate desuccinylase [Succinivibrio sp.]|nr:succinyl-diaminopimelate desuccinylase [Succinivibrio sp.]
MELSPTQQLAQALVRIPSVTPDDMGCQDLIKDVLKPLGFTCLTLEDSGTTNLLATHGHGSPFILFLGHTDVVPTGDKATWDHDPFCGDIYDYDNEPCLYGRGSADMKGGDAAMIMALRDYVKANPHHHGTLALLVTSNEEGDAAGGVPFVVDYMKAHRLIPEFCIVGEPSCDDYFGDQIKNGRRGDLNATIILKGIQGHVAQPEYCDNAAHKAARFIAAMLDNPIDHGSEFFPPTSFQVSNMKCGTGADNVVPGTCQLRCNWRYNDMQSKESIEKHVEEILKRLKIEHEISWQVDGLPFLTKDGELLNAMSNAITKVLGKAPSLGTKGGTSDGRFIAPLGAQTIEFGPLSSSIHQVNEHVSLKNLDELKQIFEKTIGTLIEENRKF